VTIAAFAEAKPDTARHITGMLADSFAFLGMDFAGQVTVTASRLGEAAKKAAALAEARSLGKRIASGG